jgi:hypothetical protein
MTPIRTGFMLSGIAVTAWILLVAAAIHTHDSLAGVAVISLTLITIALLLVVWFGVLVAWGWVSGATARNETDPTN